MTTAEYLALSKLAYQHLGQYISRPVGALTIGDLIDDKANSPIKDYKDSSNKIRPEYVALSGLSSWEVVASRSFASFAATAFQNPETGEIVFAFRGSDDIGDWIGADLKIATFIPQILNSQFQHAKQFVFDTLNKYGPVCYDSQEDMFNSLNQHSNISFTGHSLGGGLAQYMTYVTSNMDNDDIGVKSVTFNAVGVGQNTWDTEIWRNGYRYNSEDHVNSLDLVGMYGMQLGSTIRHIDASDIDYSKVNFDALGEMLAVRLQLSRGAIDRLEYGRAIDEIKKTIATESNGKTIKETMTVYRGYESVGGSGGSGPFDMFSHHSLGGFLEGDPAQPGSQYVMTQTVDSQEIAVNRLRSLFNLINAFQVVERAKIDGNYVADIQTTLPLSGVYMHDSVAYYQFVILPDGSASTQSYSRDQIAYANYIIQKFERSLSNGTFAATLEEYNKAISAPRVDPLMFDLNGDGQYTTSLDGSNVYFDLDANGFAERTAWAASQGCAS